MRRSPRETVLGGILFAAGAACAAVAWQLAAGSALGGRTAVASFAAVAVVAHLMWIAPDLRRGAAAAFFAALALGAAGVGAPWLDALLAAAAVVLAVGRSGFLFRRSAARALAVEGLLLGAGLLLARVLAGPHPLGVGAAVWGFFLVQALYPVIGGVRPRDDRQPGIDPFEDARRRALAVMEG